MEKGCQQKIVRCTKLHVKTMQNTFRKVLRRFVFLLLPRWNSFGFEAREAGARSLPSFTVASASPSTSTTSFHCRGSRREKETHRKKHKWQARTMQRHVEKGQCRNQSREILTLKKAVTKSGEPKATSSDKSPCQQQFSGFETQVCKTYFKKNIYGKVSKNTLNYCNPVYSQVIARRRTHLHLEIVAGSSIALPTNRASRVVCFFAVLSFFGVLLSSPFHSFLTYLFTYLSIQFGITFRSVGTNACHRVSYAISQRRSRLWADRQLSN